MSQETAARWLHEVMGGDLFDTQLLSRWAIENGRLKPWAGQSRDALLDAQLDAADFALIVGAQARAFKLLPIRDVAEVTDKMCVVRAGERDKGIAFLTSWFTQLGVDSLMLIDPFARGQDIADVVSSMPGLRYLHAIVGNATPNFGPIREPQAIIDEARGAWLHISDGAFVALTITTVGTEAGECPIHDRWILGEISGLKLGTSVSGLGHRDSEIVVIDDSQVTLARQTNTRWIILPNPRLGDARIVVRRAEFPSA